MDVFVDIRKVEHLMLKKRKRTTKGLIVGRGPNWGLSFAITIGNEGTACPTVIDFQIFAVSYKTIYGSN